MAYCDVSAREYGKCHAGETEEQCEQRTEVNEPAVEPPSSRSRGITASQEAMAGICGASGVFLFHDWILRLGEAHSRGVETLSAPLWAGGML